MADILIRLCIGPSSADEHNRVVSNEQPLSDLLIYWKKDFRLPEQDQHGELILYGLYRDEGSQRVRLDVRLSLRHLRFQAHQALYLANVKRPWWSGVTAPLNLNRVAPPKPRPIPPTGSPPNVYIPVPPISVTPCSIELAPGCVRQIGETGLIINRDYLLRELPSSVYVWQKALSMLGVESRLTAVSRDDTGHCSIVWRQAWYLIAHSPIYIGTNKYSRNEALNIDQTTTFLIGRDGWPATIRLHSTSIARL